MTSGLRLVRAGSALALLGVLGGCLYSFVGGGLPRHVNRVYIEPFENTTPFQVLTSDLLQLLQDRVPGNLGVRLSGQQAADAIVRGRITSVEDMVTAVAPTTTPGGRVQPQQTQVQIRFEAEIFDLVEDRVLWRGTSTAIGNYDPDRGEHAEVGRRRALEDAVRRLIEGAQSQW